MCTQGGRGRGDRHVRRLTSKQARDRPSPAIQRIPASESRPPCYLSERKKRKKSSVLMIKRFLSQLQQCAQCLCIGNSGCPDQLWLNQQLGHQPVSRLCQGH
jgi:hypothetical protein